MITMNNKILPLLLTLAAAFAAYPQEASITAVRVIPSPKINGELDDEAWTHAAPITHFTQREPH